jgi:hypothetical protein
VPDSPHCTRRGLPLYRRSGPKSYAFVRRSSVISVTVLRGFPVEVRAAMEPIFGSKGCLWLRGSPPNTAGREGLRLNLMPRGETRRPRPYVPTGEVLRSSPRPARGRSGAGSAWAQCPGSGPTPLTQMNPTVAALAVGGEGGVAAGARVESSAFVMPRLAPD